MARARAETGAQLAALEERVKRLDAALQLLARPFQQLDAEIENELAQLALSVGKQLARRELHIEPTQVIAILRESLALLPTRGARSAGPPASGGCRDGAGASHRSCGRSRLDDRRGSNAVARRVCHSQPVLAHRRAARGAHRRRCRERAR